MTHLVYRTVYKQSKGYFQSLQYQRNVQVQTPWDYLKSQNFSHSLIILFFITLSIQRAQSATIFKVYPLAEDYFEKIYMVNHESKQYYLTVACKEKDMLSISLTQTRDFQEAPRYNIYGTNKTIPKMGQNTYTFLKECSAVVQVDTPNFFEVKRTVDSEPIFSLSNVTFRHLHNSFTVNDPSTKWGLGERFQTNFRVTEGRWTIWNRDKAWAIDRGSTGVSDQTYGHHPLYLAREKHTNLYHLAYFKNTYGLLIEATKDADHLVYNSVGGNIHFIIILGQHNPEEVLEQYHDYIGKSHIPPFWSMGYHQCRWGYKSSAALNQVLQKFEEHDLPIDTIWSDLDYMDQKMIFTVNPITHGGNSLNNMMKNHQVSFIPLMDVGVSTKDSIAMQAGTDLDIYLRNPKRMNEYYNGQVWPGQVHFVDFLHPKANGFWKNQLHRLYELVKFSGLWLDMNEPSNFQGNEPTQEPFKIQQNQGINQMTINVDIPHYSNSTVGKLYHREVHAYFGHLSTVHTHQFFKEVGQRPFIISRSNSVGTGHFSGHWTGDNVATWQFLRLSISGNFLHQIFGIQMVGADICGFHLDTTEQLCSRWMQLGSFYPFSRNHNEDVPRPQQPYTFGRTLLDTSRLSLKTRYALLKQLYSIMVMKKGKGSFFRPIGFEFYDDKEAFIEENLQTQFLIGKGLMIAPIVYQNTSDRDVYFPSSKETWYSFKIDSQTGKVQTRNIKKYKGGKTDKVDNPLPAAPPSFVRGGHSLMTNEPGTRATKLNSQFHLFAALKNGESFTQVLGIEDYNKEAHLSQCIEQGCALHIALKKEEDNSFILSWNYKGPQNIKGTITIESIFAVENDQKWTYEGEIKLSEAHGEYKLKGKQI